MVSRENQVLIISSVVALLVLVTLATFTNLSTLARVAVAVIIGVSMQPVLESFGH